MKLLDILKELPRYLSLVIRWIPELIGVIEKKPKEKKEE